MASAVFDLVGAHTLEKGLPWRFSFVRYAGPKKTPVDMTGCAAKLVLSDVMDPEADGLVFSSDGGHINLSGTSGQVEILLSAADTLAVAGTNLRYRLYVTDSLGMERLLLRGRVATLEVNQ